MSPAALFALVGGRKGALVLFAGFALGVGAANVDAHLRKIPAAEKIARAEERARFSAEVADAIAASVIEAREIEKGVQDATDEELRCLISGACR